VQLVTCWHWLCNVIRAKTVAAQQQLTSCSRGLHTFLPEGHISYYTTAGGPNILHNVIVSGYISFYQPTDFSLIQIFFIGNITPLWAGWNGFAGHSLEALSYSKDYILEVYSLFVAASASTNEQITSWVQKWCWSRRIADIADLNRHEAGFLLWPKKLCRNRQIAFTHEVDIGKFYCIYKAVINLEIQISLVIEVGYLWTLNSDLRSRKNVYDLD